MKNLVAVACLALIAEPAPSQEALPDTGKFRVEGPLQTRMLPPLAPSKAAPLVPLVNARGVDWHADLDAAKAAAAKSKKPILLFQLLGKLDDEFC